MSNVSPHVSPHVSPGVAASSNMSLSDPSTSRSYKAQLYRDGRLQPSSASIKISSWNIEGLTDSKIIELQNVMMQGNIGIICLQETHKSQSEYWITEDGFLVVLSGAANAEDTETAGVGFLIAPGVRRSIIGFRQATSRVAYLKLRVPGGKVAVCSIYALHNGKPAAERQQQEDRRIRSYGSSR